MPPIPMPWPTQEMLDKVRMHQIGKDEKSKKEKAMAAKPADASAGYTTRAMQAEPAMAKVPSPEPDADDEKKPAMAKHPPHVFKK